MSRTVTIEKYVDVEVEVDLTDFSTNDLITELNRRNAERVEALGDDIEEDFDALYEIMARGDKERAYHKMREVVEAVTGRILP